MLDRMKGGLIGLAAGDALGVPVEFMPREQLMEDPVEDMFGWGTHSQPPGTWSDDTGLALAAMDSLRTGFDPENMMECFKDWRHGCYWPYDEVFDVGVTTDKAIGRYVKGVPAEACGCSGERDNGNGALMRILPMAFYLYPQYGTRICQSEEAMRMIHEACRLTHAHPRSMIGCGIYVSIACQLLSGQKIRAATHAGIMEAAGYYIGQDYVKELNYYGRLADVEDLCRQPKAAIRSTGYVVDTLEAALYCLNNTRTFKECALMAVNLGEDTDTVAAVACGLAGIYYGIKGIPAAWKLLLPKRGEMEILCEEVYAFSSREEK